MSFLTTREYPTLLTNPAPRLKVYPRETVVAEKYQALVHLGLANSRMKDFYDLWIIAHEFDFDGQTLSDAIRNTFSRRGTAIPEHTPSGLGREFCEDTPYGAKTASLLSSCFPIIEIEHTPEPLATLNRPIG